MVTPAGDGFSGVAQWKIYSSDDSFITVLQDKELLISALNPTGATVPELNSLLLLVTSVILTRLFVKIKDPK